MEVSVIIATYNRTKELDMCLDSVLTQTVLPKEVLIIDNGTDNDTSDLIETRKAEFEESRVTLKYIRNTRENSLTVARNIGVRNSSGDVISFLDDDLVLERDYYKEILKVFHERPEALGVTGFNTNVRNVEAAISASAMARLSKTFFRVFRIGWAEEHGCRLLPSLGVTYPPFGVGRAMDCEWLSGASAYKRNILELVKPDENLKKYSWDEDSDLSYRIFKRHPGSLFLTPYAKYMHRGSPAGRLPERELSYMAEVYDLYVFFKIIDQTFRNRLVYVWSRAGRLTYLVLKSVRKSKPKEIGHVIGACLSCLRHMREIKQGDLDFFNSRLSR